MSEWPTCSNAYRLLFLTPGKVWRLWRTTSMPLQQQISKNAAAKIEVLLTCSFFILALFVLRPFLLLSQYFAFNNPLQVREQFPANMKPNCRYRKRVGYRRKSVPGCVIKCLRQVMVNQHYWMRIEVFILIYMMSLNIFRKSKMYV